MNGKKEQPIRKRETKRVTAKREGKIGGWRGRDREREREMDVSMNTNLLEDRRNM